jgi:predicted DNA binding CopG/RHH family protein
MNKKNIRKFHTWKLTEHTQHIKILRLSSSLLSNIKKRLSLFGKDFYEPIVANSQSIK